MERARDAKRSGSRRHHKTSGHRLLSALNGVDGEILERHKKEKCRGSTKEDGEIMRAGSDEEEFPSQRFKLNEKALDDCNAVDPATVPRRLRSAMNKRSRESVSPPLPDPKRNNRYIVATESAHFSGVNRSKPHMKLGRLDKGTKPLASNAITKDEEEVAEALYALAGMADEPDTHKADRITEGAELYPSLPETKGDSVLPLEALKEESEKSPDVLADPETIAPNFCKEEPTEKTGNIEPLLGHAVCEQPTCLDGEKFNRGMNDGSLVEEERSELLSNDQWPKNHPLNDPAGSSIPMEVPSESYPGNRSKEEKIQPKYLPTSSTDCVSDLAVAVAAQEEKKSFGENVECTGHSIELVKDPLHSAPNGRNGASDGLWHLMQSSSTKAVSWGGSTTGASLPCTTKNDISKEKPKVFSVGRRQSFKRCAYHMYICRLIQAYKSTEEKSIPSSANQLCLNEVKTSCIMSSNDSSAQKTDLNIQMSLGTHCSMEDRNLQAIKQRALQNNLLLQDQHASASSIFFPPQKQRCDFLSLSAGGESVRNPGNGLEYSSQLHVPYVHPFVQHQVMPLSLAQSYSSQYVDQLASVPQQVPLQLPQYSGNPFFPPQSGKGNSAKQQLLAAQVARHRPRIGSPTQLSNWQNGRHDSSISTQSSIVPQSSIEFLGSKMIHLPNPQQVFAASLPRGKLQHLHNHSGPYDDNGPPHLQQLLCNAHNIK